MSTTIESNLKNQPSVPCSILSISSPTPLLLPNSLPLTPTSSLPSTPSAFYDDRSTEKLYKKQKQILFEFDQIVKGIEICHSP
jgi:hypothetical protein